MLRKLWSRLPLDGMGWAFPAEPALRRLARASVRQYRGRFPAPLLPLFFAARYALWPVAAFAATARFTRSEDLSFAKASRLFADCVLSGSEPMDAHLWRALSGRRPALSQRAAGIILAGLGDPRAHQILADKRECARLLESLGLAVPKTIAVVGPASPLTESLLDYEGDLFIKPRRGSGGRGAFALRASGNGQWRARDGTPLDRTGVIARLRTAAAHEDILVQERLIGCVPGLDLPDTGWTTVLRLTTAREPGGEPFLHSALLVVPVPGRAPRDFLRGALQIPIDLATGRLRPGILFSRCDERVAAFPWNGTVFAGQSLAIAAPAVAALRAMAMLPPLPIVNWDIVPAKDGPRFLEGNSGGNWLLTNLPGIDGGDRSSLPSLLCRWAAAIR